MRSARPAGGAWRVASRRIKALKLSSAGVDIAWTSERRVHCFVLQRNAQRCARTRQARHHGADRDAGHLGDFFVRHVFQFAQHDHLAKRWRQCLDRGVDAAAPRASLPQHGRVGHSRWRRDAVLVLIVEGERLGQRVVLPQPVVAGVAHDAQQPWPRVVAAQAVEKTERAQIGLLHRIVRVLFVAQQPAREVVGRAQMRQCRRFEVSRAVGQRNPPPCSQTA
jgi:hypothetical protein